MKTALAILLILFLAAIAVFNWLFRTELYSDDDYSTYKDDSDNP